MLQQSSASQIAHLERTEIDLQIESLKVQAEKLRLLREQGLSPLQKPSQPVDSSSNGTNPVSRCPHASEQGGL